MEYTEGDVCYESSRKVNLLDHHTDTGESNPVPVVNNSILEEKMQQMIEGLQRVVNVISKTHIEKWGKSPQKINIVKAEIPPIKVCITNEYHVEEIDMITNEEIQYVNIIS